MVALGALAFCGTTACLRNLFKSETLLFPRQQIVRGMGKKKNENVNTKRRSGTVASKGTQFWSIVDGKQKTLWLSFLIGLSPLMDFCESISYF